MADKQTAQALLKQSRRRLVGSLMGYLEQSVYPRLSEAERSALRSKVLAAVDANHDFAMDLIGVYAEDQPALINERVLELLGDIHEAVRRD